MVWANVNGIVNGTSDTTFSPDSRLTRQQLAAILYRYARAFGGDTSYTGNLSHFTDRRQVDTYAVTPMDLGREPRDHLRHQRHHPLPLVHRNAGPGGGHPPPVPDRLSHFFPEKPGKIPKNNQEPTKTAADPAAVLLCQRLTERRGMAYD